MIRLLGARRRFLGPALAAGAAALGACSISAAPDLNVKSGLGCVDDSPACVSQRQTTLKSLVGDHKRAWVKEQPTLEAYASGVRLFAYKQKKKDLSCEELAHGRKEADNARHAMAGAGAKLTPAQVSRGAMLAAEVSRELKREMERRCKV